MDFALGGASSGRVCICSLRSRLVLFILFKMVELVGGGSLIKGAYPVKFIHAAPISILVEPNKSMLNLLIG